VSIVSATSSDRMQRNTFGRSLILGFTVNSTKIARGRAACGKVLPTLDGKCRMEIPGEKVIVLK
jgi:hypothetical protein